MAEQLQVEKRDAVGKHRNRRLRESGKIPAILYGHGRESVPLSVPAEQIAAAIRHGSRMVELSGAVNESAFIREVQRDTWGQRVLHVDFTRVSADERIEVELPVELRGEAPGFREGGVVEQVTHRVTIECRASAIPEKLELSVNELGMNESLTAAEIELPRGAKLLDEPQTTIVTCSPPVEVPEEVEEAAEAEPEVIGAKEQEEAEGGEAG